MTPRRAILDDVPGTPVVSGVARRAFEAPSRPRYRRTLGAFSAVLATAAVGAAVVLPLTGGQPYAVTATSATSTPAAAEGSGVGLAATASAASVVGTPTTSAADTTTTTTTSASASTGAAPAASTTSTTTSTTTTSTTTVATSTTTTTAPAATTTTSSTPTKTATASPTATKTATASPTSNSSADKVVAYAMNQLGAPYQVGAMGPTYFDCSGLVAAAYQAAGYDMPHSELYEATHGTAVDLADLRPGDVLAWGSTLRAISLYVGNGTIIIADGPDYGVRTVKLADRLAWDTLYSARRYFN